MQLRALINCSKKRAPLVFIERYSRKDVLWFQSTFVDLEWDAFFFFLITEKIWEHREQVIPASHVLMDGTQTSPEVYRHRYAALDHFCKCLQLHGDWRWGQFMWHNGCKPGRTRKGNRLWLLQDSKEEVLSYFSSYWNHAQNCKDCKFWWSLHQKPPHISSRHL